MNANNSPDGFGERAASFRLPIILTAALVGSIAHLAGAGTGACIGSVLASEFVLILISLLP